ncbi:MAG: Gldg family protein, partial [Chrysiogenetes bacterium]|nr:Gldg family protein [Chrysiogenetes bacterium]
MRGFLAVFKKEVRTYLFSPSAYVFIASFLALVGFFYSETVELYAREYLMSQQNPFAGGPSDINEFFRISVIQFMVTFFLFLMPLLTMRLIAAEKKAKTDELLFTSPVSTASVLLGKFAAALMVVVVSLGLTLYVPYFAGKIAPLDMGPLVASYLSLLGLGGCFIALGLFASALTDDQIIAAVVSFVGLLVLMILPFMASSVENETLRAVLEYMAYQDHFDQLTKGLIELRDVVYIASFMVLFLFLAHEYLVVGQSRSQSAQDAPSSRWILAAIGMVLIVVFFAVQSIIPATELEPQSWQKGLWIGGAALIAAYFALEWERMVHAVKTRSFVFASLASVQVIVVVGIIGGANWMANRRNVKWDLTDVGLYTLAPQSVKIVQGLDEPTEIAVFMRDTEPTRAQLRDVLRLYEAENENLKVRFIDPDKNPIEARDYKVDLYNTLVFTRGEGENQQRTRINSQSEEDITAALIKISRDERRSVCFMSGHGEKDVMSEEVAGYDFARKSVEGQGYEIRSVDQLGDEGLAPCTVLIIAGPQRDPLPGELKKVDQWLRSGGQAIVMVDPTPSAGLTDWLAGYGVEVRDDVVVDVAAALLGSNYLTTLATPPFLPHQIVRDLPGQLVFPGARTLNRVEPAPEGMKTQVVLNTREDVWGEVDLASEESPEFVEGRDHEGPQALAIAVEISSPEPAEAGEGDAPAEKKPGRLLVIGDSDFANNQFIYTGSFNSDFFLNSISWL